MVVKSRRPNLIVPGPRPRFNLLAGLESVMRGKTVDDLVKEGIYIGGG